MKEERTAIGVDFGTANSYFSKKEAGNGVLQNFSWGSNDSDINHYILETAVLYNKEENNVVGIGQKAVEEYYSNPDENYDLIHWFKPEIHSDPEARKAATDFFMAAQEQQRGENRVLFPENADIVVGIPADTDSKYEETLRKIIAPQLRNGTELHFAEEPKGALIYFLDHKKIDIAKLKSCILVVDFGAGTCDFTLIKNGEIASSWNDPQLGGRLFDDVLYNLFTKHHPKASLLKELPIRSKKIIQHHFCREEKHKFSDSIRVRCKRSENSDNLEADLEVSLGSSLRGENANLAGSCKITYGQFLEEARKYVPSDVMMHCFNTGKQTPFAKLLAQSCNQPEDLVQRFLTALRPEKLKGEEVLYIYLAGGSSKLPFVETEIRKALGDNTVFEGADLSIPLKV